MSRLKDTYIENRERIQPHQANNYGTVHGGVLMMLMDEIGAMSAMRFARETCVTAGVRELDFENPIPVGDIALIEAYVYAAGRTSVRVRLRAWREAPRTGERSFTNSSCFVFVAVDEDGKPVAVPDLAVETDRERELRDEALAEESDDR